METRYTAENWPSEKWPNFSFKEMACQHSGICNISDDLMDKLQELRIAVGFGLIVSSGYRDVTHPIEAAKVASGKAPKGGAHASGKACDLAVDREKAYIVLREAMRIGFTGIGVAQSGDGRFLHLDCIEEEDGFHVPRPTLWSY